MGDLLKTLNIDPTVLLMNAIVFLVLLQILDKVFWKPVMQHLQKRKESITQAYKTVDDTRREMENLRSEYQQRMAQIESEARGRIQQTVRAAQAEREQALAQARAEAEQVVRAGAERIQAEARETLATMRSGLDEVALNALAKAIGAPTGAVQRQLVDEYIAQDVLKQ